MKIFLGGTCNESTWRDELIPLLKENDLEFFNPVVDDWTDEAKQIEEQEKETSDVRLYVLTPKMTGVFSIAELVHDAITGDELVVIFVILTKDGDKEFDFGQLSSLKSVATLLKPYGVPTIYDDLNKVVTLLIHAKKELDT